MWCISENLEFVLVWLPKEGPSLENALSVCQGRHGRPPRVHRRVRQLRLRQRVGFLREPGLQELPVSGSWIYLAGERVSLEGRARGLCI